MRPLLRALACTAPLALAACGGGPPIPPEEVVKVPAEGTVVVFVEAPRYIAGPILKMFSEQTGIVVQATYREEAGPGFADQLDAAVAAGKADLLWGASPLLAIELQSKDRLIPFRPAGARAVPLQYHDRSYRWIGFAANPRVILAHDSDAARDRPPAVLEDLVVAPWAGKAVLARPAEGTAAFQAAALFARLGSSRGREFFERVAAAGNLVVEDDAEVRRLVAAGERDWGFVDLDRAICSKRQGEPVSIIFPDRLGMGAVAIPEVIALLKGAPNPDQARGLIGYLFSTDAIWAIGQNDCALISLLPVNALGIPKPEWVPVLSALNVQAIDNQKVFDAWTQNRSFLKSWGTAATAR
ncbi:MAG TPA: extracellular solute-binding protein [Candidatus Polarisedimenticolia bacterium]|nr:extracellular solute-binding protein [Candidatus Polarisedimenticolia bacterium]